MNMVLECVAPVVYHSRSAMARPVTLNQVGYTRPLSVEWEDSCGDREHGAMESCAFVKKVDFKSSRAGFDAAWER
jgi:hypothetical protein